jgi:hypothetical protein
VKVNRCFTRTSPPSPGLKSKPNRKPACLLTASWWFLAYSTPQSRRWRKRVPPKHWLTYTAVHSVIFQKRDLVVTTIWRILILHLKLLIFIRFEVLMLVAMKISVFQDVMPCSLVEVYQHSWEMCSLHLHFNLGSLKMDAAQSFKISLHFCLSTWCHPIRQ